MAKIPQSIQNVRQILTDIRSGKMAPVYILHGEEPYFIDLITDTLEQYAIPEEDRDFNFDLFFGPDADVDYVIGAAKQFPVMAQRRLVLLKEGQAIFQGRATLEKFAPYVSNPSTATVFVLQFKGDSLNATSELLKAAKKGGGIIFKSDVPPEWELETHVRNYCNEYRISIEDKALNLMAEYIGMPLSKFFGELRKLYAIKGEGHTITAADVERNIGISKDFNNYELVNAVAEKNYPKAIRIIKYFENSPRDNLKNKHSMMTASTLFAFFANLVTAHYLPDKSDDTLKEALGIKGVLQLRTLKTGLRNYSAMKAVNAIHYLREYDTKVKGIDSNSSDGQLLGELLFKLFT